MTTSTARDATPAVASTPDPLSHLSDRQAAQPPGAREPSVQPVRPDASGAAGNEDPGASGGKCEHGVSPAEATLARCVRIVDEFLTAKAEALFTGAKEVFFIAARDAESSEEESRQIALMEEVEDLQAPISSAFMNVVRASMEAMAQGEGIARAQKEEPQATDVVLSLVDTCQIDDVVVFSRVLRRHLGAIAEDQKALEQHWSELIGISIDGAGNPVSLETLCNHFHEAIENMGASRPVRAAIFDAFEATVVAELNALHKSLIAAEPEAVDYEHGGDSAAGGGTGDGDEHELDEAADTAPGSGDASVIDDLEVAALEAAAGIRPDTDAPAGRAASRGAAADTGATGAPEAPDAARPAAAATPEPVGAEKAKRAQRGSGEQADPERFKSMLALALRSARCEGFEEPSDAASLEAWLARGLARSGALGVAPEQRAIEAVSRAFGKALADEDLDDSVKSRLWQISAPVLALVLDGDGPLEDRVASARHDPVTGLLDRAAFRTQLKRRLAARAEHVVCLFEVDRFDDLERQWGASVSSRLLRTLSILLTKHGGSRMVAARLGGGTFAVLLDRYQLQRGRRFADRLRRAVRESSWSHAGNALDLSISAGLLASQGEDTDPDEVMRAVEAALGTARSNGGAQVVTHDPAQPAGKGKPSA